MRDESVAFETWQVKTIIYFELAADMQCWTEEARYGSLVGDTAKEGKNANKKHSDESG